MTKNYDKERVVACAEQLLDAIFTVLGDGWTYQIIVGKVRRIVWWVTDIMMKDKENDNETQG